VFGTEITYRLPEHRDRNENPEELCAGLEWMEDRGMVSREHTLRLSDHDGKMIANKNDHLWRLILRKRRAMATMIITQCLKSYDINAYDQNRWTPLHITVMYVEPELCRLLCERGDVDVDKGHKYGGDTALHRAASNGRMECMRILLDMGKANVNAKDNYSNTPLHDVA
jgi:ankyrin repeat protein